MPIKKILIFSLLLFTLTGLAGSVFATGKECSKDADCPSTAVPKEQCCCCWSNKSCDTTVDNETAVKGRCFPTKIYTGSNYRDPATQKFGPMEIVVNCSDVVCPFSQHTNIKQFIDAAVNYAFYISIILVPLMVVLGGFLLMVSTGNSKQAKLGREIIQWSVIGFAITLFAKSISSIIKMILVG